ncbi:MAG: CehA/McbA family metallohydrolase, partial [Ignavibacteriaceae bacterium]|nr:CehA/McbA family metallohydrolase [Ignavibacteriaceae bacterium]
MKKYLNINRLFLFAVLLSVLSTYSLLAQKKDVFIPNSCRQIIYGKVIDSKGDPLIAQVQVWYYPLRPVVENYGDSKIQGRTDNLIKMTYTTDKGFFSVRVPADTVVLMITKGPEWSLVKKVFVIKGREFNGIECNVTLQRLYDLGKLGIYSGDAHHHSIFSDGFQTPSEAANAMVGVGLSWGFLTDHNSTGGLKEWLSYKTKYFLPISGCEITTEPSELTNENGFGHMNQSFITEMNGKDVANPNIWARERFDGHNDVQSMIDLTHKQNGFFAVNHPFQSWDWSGRFKSWGKVKYFDAIEVWNGEPPRSFTMNTWDTNHININTWAVNAWYSYLNEGNRISGIAGSDCHDVYGVNAYPKGDFYWTTTTGNPRTYAYCKELSETNIKKAMKDGNLFLTSNFGPLLLISVDKKNPGEVVRVPGSGKVHLKIEVLANQKLLHINDAVRVIYNGKI